MLLKFSAFVTAALCILSSANADLERGSSKDSVAHRRAVLAARDLENTALPASVKRDLQAMSPEDYELFPRAAGDGIKFNPGGSARDGVDNWVNGHGPGRGNCQGGQLALTSDDGPFSETKKVSDLGVHINHFFNGLNYGCIYDKANVKRMRASFDAGNTIGTHTWGHVNLTDGLTAEEIDRQIELLETATWKILGVVPKFIRPPYGEMNRTVLAYLKEKHDLIVVQWSDDTGDANGDSTETSIAMYETFKKGENHLILSHADVKPNTTDYILPAALKHFKKEGITPVSLEQCLKGNPKPYKATGKRQKRDDTWTCVGTPAPGVP